MMFANYDDVWMMERKAFDARMRVARGFRLDAIDGQSGGGPVVVPRGIGPSPVG